MPGQRDDRKSNGGVLVLGDYKQTLTIARSLARTDYRVIVGTSGLPPAYTRYSRCVSEHWRAPGYGLDLRGSTAQEFAPALLEFLSRRPDITHKSEI